MITIIIMLNREQIISCALIILLIIMYSEVRGKGLTVFLV